MDEFNGRGASAGGRPMVGGLFQYLGFVCCEAFNVGINMFSLREWTQHETSGM